MWDLIRSFHFALISPSRQSNPWCYQSSVCSYLSFRFQEMLRATVTLILNCPPFSHLQNLLEFQRKKSILFGTNILQIYKSECGVYEFRTYFKLFLVWIRNFFHSCRLLSYNTQTRWAADTRHCSCLQDNEQQPLYSADRWLETEFLPKAVSKQTLILTNTRSISVLDPWGKGTVRHNLVK